MSEQQFKEAKGNLAFSQTLVDQMRQRNQVEAPMMMPQEEPEMEMKEEVVEEAEPFEGEETPEEEVKEEKSIVDTIKETIAPFMERIEGLFKKKEEEPKEVEIKIDGEMKPKEEEK